MAAAIDYTYSYGFHSGLVDRQYGRPHLALATSNADQTRPYFFDGKVRSPRTLGALLYTLSDVVRTHFFLPRPALLDPVLTSSENMLRLEGFSGCCGVYARVDLPASAFDGDCMGRGTTNVDFNTPMRAALLRLRDNDDVEFAVGADEVVLSQGETKTVEKKVKLPVRWVKCFSEVQSYQPKLELRAEISAADALRFVRTLPKSERPKMPSYVVSVGKSVRLSQRPQKGAVRFEGTHRVRVIEPLLAIAQKLRIWSDDDNGTSAWEVCFAEGSFFMMISPEVFRGFSGEGQLLTDLVNPPTEQFVASVRAQLKWSAQIDAADIASRIGASESDVRKAIATLSTRGLAGFDASAGQFFHRELPFDLSLVDEMQPRLKAARKLVAENKVTKAARDADSARYAVQGTGTIHQVTLSEERDACTCPWYSKHLGGRGPCKHILAAQIIADGDDEAAA